MTNEHITRLEVSNFKKFDRLVVENIGQINLITGDNNVGKTSLLEVLCLGPSLKENLGIMRLLLQSKNPLFGAIDPSKFSPSIVHKENVFAKFLCDVDLPFKLEIKRDDKIVISLRVENTNLKLSHQTEDVKTFIRKVIDEYPEVSSLSENWLLSYENEKLNFAVDVQSTFYRKFISLEAYLMFLTPKKYYDEELWARYKSFNPDLESKTLNLLNIAFDSVKLEGIRLSGLEVQVNTKSRKEWHSITEYGDGLIRVFRFIVTLLHTQNKRLLIDEVEIGLHYLRQKDMFKILFRLAKETNVQLFCTTHSQDCIKAFVEAAEEMREMKDKIRLIELEEALSEKSDRKVFASSYNFDQIVAGLNSDVNLRGGKY